MPWLKAVAAFLMWIAAHAAAALVFLAFVTLVVPPFSSTWAIAVDGLAAGLLFGLGQWLVLRIFLPAVRWWLPATAIASPISWWNGMLFAVGTLGLGGWVGGLFSGAVQASLLAYFLRRRGGLVVGLSVGYLSAAALGSLIFYFAFLDATGGPDHALFFRQPVEAMLAGSIAFGSITGIVVALLVRFGSEPQPNRGAVVSTR